MTLQELIQRLENTTFREKAIYDFSVINPGNWEAVVKWAANNGCVTTIQELKKYAEKNPGFFKRSGQQPNLGWNTSTLFEG